MATEIKSVAEKSPAGITTAVEEVLENNARRPQRDVTQAIYTVLWGVALPCIPIIVVSAVLLSFIFKYRVVPRPGWPEFYLAENGAQLQNISDYIHEIRHDGGEPAYYVDYNPSTLTTIAGWSGRVIPYLSSSIMAMVAFYAARHLVLKSKHGHHDELPTPKQLNILISLLGGSGFGPLKDAVAHRWGSKEKFVAPLPAVFAALATITLIGILIPFVDTWFGVAVHPATIVQLYNTSTDAYHSFGRQLNPDNSSDNALDCANGPGTAASQGLNSQPFWWPCNMFIATPHLDNIFLQGAQAASSVELDQPSNNTISNYTGPALTASSAGTAQDNHTMYFMADQRSSKNVDFRARTMGITTQCQIATSDCYRGDNGSAFQCPNGFAGDFTSCEPNVWPANGTAGESCDVGIGFSPDAKLSSAAGDDYLSSGSAITMLLQQNPIYFATWATGYPAAGDSNNPLWQDINNGNNSDPQIFQENGLYAHWLLNCSATIYDVDYTFVNGTLHTIQAVPAEPEWGAFYSAPFAWLGLAGLTPVRVALTNAAYLASYTAQNSTDLANIWAREFSKMAMATPIGVFVPMANDLEQVRNNTVNVTRVPMIPLYLLLGLKFLYVIVVIILAIGVYCFTHPAETEVVKAQLSVKGLVAAHFDQPDLIRSNVVKEVQSRLDQTSLGATGGADAAASSAPNGPAEGVKTAAGPTSSSEQVQGDGGVKKVGLVPTPEGTWKFALVVNGAWESVKPIVKDIVLVDAQAGKFGEVGKDYAAWK